MLTLPMLLILQPIILSPVLIPIRRCLACCSFRCCCCCASMCIGRCVDCEGRGNSWLRQPCNGVAPPFIASSSSSSTPPPSHTSYSMWFVCQHVCLLVCRCCLLPSSSSEFVSKKRCAHSPISDRRNHRSVCSFSIAPLCTVI